MKISIRYAFTLLIGSASRWAAGRLWWQLFAHEKSAKEAAFEEAEKKISSDLDQVIHDLPSPTEVPYMLQATGSDFNGTLINGLENLSKYETNEEEASLNLGVYATDMGYLLSYEKVSESRQYMEACQKLAETLGVASSI